MMSFTLLNKDEVKFLVSLGWQRWKEKKTFFLDIKSDLEGSLIRGGKGSFVREWKGKLCGRVQKVIQCDLNLMHSNLAQMRFLS